MLGLFIVTLVAAASAEIVINDGPCPDVKPIDNFNVTSYQGLWYGITQLPSEAMRDGKCGTARYTVDGDVVKVRNTHIISGAQTYIDGIARFAEDANKKAKLVVTFMFGNLRRDGPLMILKTDYTSHSIAYTCRYDDKTNTHKEYLWILSRSKKLEDDAKTAVDAFLEENLKHIDPSRFTATDFSDEACKFTRRAVVARPPGVHVRH